tara:strand:- start:1823 stop:4780 length:2958 start_codon:yes stop_codon:yes gene_type:complete
MTLKTRAHNAAFVTINLAVALFAGTTNAFAPVNWDGDAGDLLWFSDDNWNPNGVPGSFDSVTVESGGRVLAESMPIEVISIDVFNGLELKSSSLNVTSDSTINDFLLTGCCTTMLDSGGGSITYLGNHVFERSPSFVGSHIIEGNAVFNDPVFVPFADLTINADAILAGGPARQSPGSSVSVTGSLTLINSTLNSQASDPDATWFFDGGDLALAGTSDLIVSDHVFVTSGTVSADTKQLEFSNHFVLQDAQIKVSNGGRVVFDANGTNTADHQLGVNLFSGEGRVELEGNFIDMGNTSATSSVTGEGLWIRGFLNIDGELSSSEIVQLRGGFVTGDGRLTIDSGTMTVLQGPTLETETIVRSGGTILLNSSLNLNNTLRIDSGGTLDLITGGILKPNGSLGPNPDLIVFGALRLPNVNSNDASIDDVSLALRSGGSLIIDDRRLILRGGSDIQGGVVTLTDTSASGFPRLLFNGSASDTYKVGGGVEFVSSGNQAEIFIGNGSSVQPVFEIDGEATFNLQGSGSRVDIRVNEVRGDENSILRNLGIMDFDRSATYSTRVENEGSLYITSATTFLSVPLVNEIAGNVIQQNTLLLSPFTLCTNKGTWTIPLAGVQIIPTLDDLDEIRFFCNNGEMRFEGGASFVNVQFRNNGTVIANGAQVSFTDAVTVDSDNEMVLQGRWISLNNGKILFPENAPTLVRGPDAEIDADDDYMPALSGIKRMESTSFSTAFTSSLTDLFFSGSTAEVKQDGTLSAMGAITASEGSQISLQSGASLESNTSITSGSDDIMLPSITDDITGVIQLSLGQTPPPSIIAPTIDIHANLTPIRDDIGVMNTTGTLTIHPTGTLQINARANALSSSINHTGDIDITGNISITPLKAYEPQVGDSFTIATVSGTIGALPDSAIDASGSGIEYAVNAIGSDIVVTVIENCPADLNMDGDINFFDVSAFLTAFNSMDPAADFNNDELFNFFDISAFLVAYNAGCP